MLKRCMLIAACLIGSPGFAAEAEVLPAVVVYMPGTCLACIDWGAYLIDNGFKVSYKETADMAALKRRLKVPKEAESVHTAVVGGYFVEGHAHAEDIKELLHEKPKARGIAVPGLPRGAPGRETSNPSCEKNARRELYDTLLVLPDGSTKRWARH